MLLSFYSRDFLPKYKLLPLLRRIVVPFKVSLPAIVIVGYITKIQSIRLLNRIDIYRSYIGS